VRTPAPTKGPGARDVTVLQTFSFDDPNDLNPFGKLLVRGLPPRVTALPFSWRRALSGGYDVLHVHWPEYLYRAPSRWKQPIKTVLSALLLLRLAVTRTALVRTVHNARPHEAGSFLERRILAALDRRTDLVIVMNESTDVGDRPSVVIPHGHYRVAGPAAPSPSAPRDSHLLLFGLLRPYKGIEELVESFGELGSERSYSLTVAGAVPDAAYATELATLAARDDRIDLRLGRVRDQELPSLIRDANLVVLPYKNLLNSGAALHALSLNRPILLRDTPAARELRAEFGQDAVHLFSGRLTSTALKDALDATRGLVWETFAVDMSRREWATVGSATADAYDSAIGRRSRT
jgi:beta-1,4-mannosyltransferase